MRRGSLGAPSLTRCVPPLGCGGVTGAWAWALTGPPPRPAQTWHRQVAWAGDAGTLARGVWGWTVGKPALTSSDMALLLYPPPPRRSPLVGCVQLRGFGRLVGASAGEAPAAGGDGAALPQRVARWSRERRSREGLQLALPFSRGEDLE